MGTSSKLIREARNLAAARGHRIGEFRLTSISGARRQNPRPCLTALCDDCGAHLGIDPASAPGVSEIWGEALENDCPGKVLADYEEPGGDAEDVEPGDVFLTALQTKLHPRRFPNMSPEFAAVVGCLLDIHITEPRLVDLLCTSDGWLLGRNEGELGFDVSLGTRSWLLENWEKLITLPEVGLTKKELRAARGLVAYLEKKDRI
jgi:hypothetical protein